VKEAAKKKVIDWLVKKLFGEAKGKEMFTISQQDVALRLARGSALSTALQTWSSSAANRIQKLSLALATSFSALPNLLGRVQIAEI